MARLRLAKFLSGLRNVETTIDFRRFISLSRLSLRGNRVPMNLYECVVKVEEFSNMSLNVPVGIYLLPPHFSHLPARNRVSQEPVDGASQILWIGGIEK